LGEVVGDNLMDLYYQRMRAIYSAESHTYKKDVPRDFAKCMKAYHFLSVHPKFEVEIPADGTKPPSKNPNALASEELLGSGTSDEPNMSFVNRPPKKVDPLEGRPPNAVMQSSLLLTRLSSRQTHR
jgi:hypothetical protein